MESKIKSPVSFEDTSIAFSSKSDYELHKDYWLFALMNRPLLVKLGTSLLQFALSIRFPIKWIVKPTVFDHFCGGETIQDCQESVQKLADFKIGSILDYSVEGEKTESGFERSAQEIKKTIDNAALAPELFPFSVFKMTSIAPFELMAKKQSGKTLTEAEEQTWERVEQRVESICAYAAQKNVRVLIDGEESWIQQVIDALAYAMMAKFNRKTALIYNTYQHYTKAALPNLHKALEKAQAEGFILGAKLVRGAYMEKERDRAEEMQYPDPIQVNKEACDQDYDAGLKFCIENIEKVHLVAGTHNEHSSIYLTELMSEHQLAENDLRIFFSQLYGMSDHISFNLAHAGFNVAKYLPYGPIKATMPYLIRRAAENTSVAGQSSREFRLLKKERKRRKK